jgi:uncharacterized protein
MFIGRTEYVTALNSLTKEEKASLIVIKGRRRIGKSTLAREFGKSFNKVYEFSGLPPANGIGTQQQKEEFTGQLAKQGIPGISPNDWSDLFFHLANHSKKEKALVILDEISWMGKDDPLFLPKLKNAWDIYFIKNPRLIMILCGSISSWIEENILSSTGFLGRVSLNINLKEFELTECNEFWGKKKGLISAIEKFKTLSVTGGVPRYLEEIRPQLSAEQNIERLCFNESGILFNEFDRIFSDLFDRRAATYRKILQSMTDKKVSINNIVKTSGIGKGGVISSYIDDMSQAGFIGKEPLWSIKTGKQSKLLNFRISDNYVRFYLKYIEPNKSRIEAGNFKFQGFQHLNNWDSVMGLQFENLVLSNRKLIKNIIGLNEANILCDGPYYQRPTKSVKGCQIDYLIQDRFNTLYLFEIKFKKYIGSEVITEVKEKIKRLKKPKNFSVRPVLIYCGELSEEISQSEFFDITLDLAKTWTE